MGRKQPRQPRHRWLASVEFAPNGFKPAARLVAYWLCDHMRPDGTGARPSVARLMYLSGLSDSAVRRALGTLRARGWLKVVGSGKGGRGEGGQAKTTEYTAVVPEGAVVPGEASEIPF